MLISQRFSILMIEMSVIPQITYIYADQLDYQVFKFWYATEDHATPYLVYVMTQIVDNQIIDFMKQAPKMMRAIMLEGPSKLAVKQIPLPKPADGEVLIKVMAAPINPSDLYFLRDGVYSQTKKTPCVPGFEGSGVVVQNGGGLLGWGLVNKKVAFTPTVQSGSYAEYAIAKSSECLPVDDSMSFQNASMSFVNPLTAIAMLDIAKSKKAKAVIVDAAASSLGRMLNRFLPHEGIEILNIVRRQQQVELLKKEGATHIINSEDAGFQETLKLQAQKLHATICYDAIGGVMTGRILKCMPKKSIIYVYGLLSGESINGVDVADLLYGHKVITGLFLPNWLQDKGTVKLLPSFFKLRSLLLHELKSQIALQCSLQEFEESLNYYVANMSKGKVIVKPHSESRPKQKIEQEKGMKKEEGNDL